MKSFSEVYVMGSRWRALLLAVVLLAAVLDVPLADASSSGITGRTNRDGGLGCTLSCHSGTASGTVSVTINGPTTLSAGQTGSYTVTSNYSANTASLKAGVDIASSDGTLSPSGNLASSGATELYHFTPNLTNASGDTVFSFSWTMPVAAATSSGHTLYATSRVWYSGNWAHAPNFGVTTAAPFTALLDGVATPSAWVYGQSGTLSTSGGETTGGVTFSSSNPSVCSVSGTSLSAVGVGSCTITATKPSTSTSSALSDTFSLTVNQATQTITFTPVSPKLATAPPFSVSASGGGSGNPIVYATSGVCTNGGATITLSGAVGTCVVTANQAGNANYLAAPQATLNITVVASGEIFPPNCQIPLGWVTSPGAMTGWDVATDQVDSESCSLKSNPLPDSGSNLSARIQFTGTFVAGNVTFRRRVSSELDFDCLRFLVDGVEQGVGGTCASLGSYVPGVMIGASGELPYATVSVPITAGSHTLVWSYDKDTFCCRGISDAVWIDGVTLPLAPPAITSPSSVTGFYGLGFMYSITASNSPWGFAATGVPPGLTVSTNGVVSGVPTTVGTFTMMVTATSGAGSVTAPVTVTISPQPQTITFPPINNKLTTASLFGPPVSGNASSGIPVVLTSSTTSVCIAGGVNGTTIQIVGPGICTLTANQAGNTNFSAAAPVVQSFQVSTAAGELFPSGCAFPSGWTMTAGANASWILDSGSNSSGGACSLRSNTITDSQTAKVQFTATFAAGTLDFKVSTSSENYWDCLFVYIDTIKQSPSNGSACALGGTGFSGALPYTEVSIPITAGSHTIVLSYEKDSIFSVGSDAVWIDDLVFPQYTLTVNKTGSTGTGTVFSDPSGIVCGSTCSSALSGSVSLSAFPNPGSYLSSWSGGGCSGNGACIVNLAGNTTVTANFALIVPPGAPQSVSSNPGNGQATISFSPPASNGGGAITLYTSTCVASFQTTRIDNAGSSPIIATGLANGVQYSCTVTATNSAGAGAASAATLVTPRTVPDAPVIGAATPGNGQASIAFTAPAFNGGALITAYTATCTSMTQPTRTASGMSSPLVVASMVNGSAYSCSVTATNAAGTGAASGAVGVAASGAVGVTPRTTPGAPVMPSAVPYDARAIINWAAPSSDGGSPITGYTVSCNGGAVTASAGSAPITLAGLVNGTTYTCTVSANNAAGSTASSAFSFVPLVNTGVALWSGICTACHEMVPAGAHLNGAGPSITALDYARANQPLMMVNSLVQALTVAERAAIANYILAQVPSAAEVTPFQTPKLIDLSNRIVIGGVIFESIKTGMSAPAHGTLSAISGSSITYTPSAGYVGNDSFTVVGSRDNGTPFTGSEITINVTVQPPPAPVITSALTATGTNGAPFNYQITASNGPTGFGATGLPNGLSFNPMTGAITGTPTVGGSFMAMISATNAGGTGNATLAITLNAGGQVITFPAQSPASRAYAPGGTFAINPLATASSGLTPTYVSKTSGVCGVSGTTVTINSAGTCTIGANQAGDVNFAAAVEVTRDVTITPTLPGAPGIGTASPGNNQAIVAFTAPTNTGGITITGYTATCTASGQPTRTGTGAVSPIIVSSLTNLVLYSCSVTATNGQGTGPASGAATVTPDQVPTAPTIVSATSASFTVNAPGSFSIVATGYPTVFTYAVTGTLPTGVTLSPTTGVLSGTPTQAGSFMVNFSVSNSGGTGMQAFTLTVNKANQTISFSNPGSQAFGAGAVPLTAVATSGLTTSFVSDTTGVCSVIGSNVTLVNVGTCTIRAQQGGSANFNVAPDVSQSFSVTQGTQTISFGAQSPATRAFVAGGTFGLSPAGTASSGLGVTHTSLTTSVCTISGTTVTMVAAGTCTIAANQPGNANYAAAAQVTQSITINGTAPGAPTLNTATGGDQKITLAFTAPASNGGSAITGYTANCGGITAPGTTSPIAVTGLTNGNSYTCTVTATNAAMLTSGNSNSMMATANALPGATVWASTCGSGGCHGNPPVTTRLNAGGADATVLDYSVAHPTGAMGAMVLIVNTLTAQQKIDVAQYIRDFIPPVSATTPANTLVGINVSSQVFLNTPSVALTSLQQASAPANGTLSFPGGTIINYTPNNGFVGNDTFTYRAIGAGVQTDVRTVSVTVTPAAPVITSSLAVSGTINQAFAYQIAASNAPTGYGATGLPAWASINTTSGAITGTPNAGGTTMVTISATGAGGTGNATLSITINLAAQSISFPAQTTLSRLFAQGGTFPVNPTATGGASGNAVTYSSTTTSVCTVSGSTVTMVAAGICTIAANQAGNASYAAAPQVTQNVTITGVAPAAPTIGTATAGNTQATISFSAPTNTGGLPITSYTVNCNGVAASGPSSPIIVSGLTNGTPYTCSVQASNLAGSSVPSGAVNVTPVAIAFTGTVESRKLHGAIVYPIPINPATPLNGAIAIEPRLIGSGHQIAFTFNNPPTSLTGLTVLDANLQPVGSAAPSFAGNDLIITLTGVPDGKRVTITATGVNNALTVSASIGFLYGDVNGSGSVTATDIAYIKALSALPFNGAKFKADINTNGAVTVSDVTAVKAQAGKTLP